MGAEEERRADTVAVSRKTATVVATVAAGAILAGGSAMFRIAVDHAALLVRVETLEQFGQDTGRRWTFDDAAREDGRQDEEIRAVREEMNQMRKCLDMHRGQEAHQSANVRINENSRQIQRMQQELDER